jgi:hypothetical protein
MTIAHWYGEGKRRVQPTSSTAVWYHSGKFVVPIRCVLVRDPEGRFEPHALLATSHTLTPIQILRYLVGRWQIEATYGETRALQWR